MKKTVSKRVLSLVLVLALFISIFPQTVWATEAEDSATEVPPTELVTEAEAEKADSAQKTLPPVIDGEMEGLREEDTKHFRLTDGSFIAVGYEAPVHYQDASGEWKDIDNTLVLQEATSKQAAAYTSWIGSDYRKQFSAELTDGTIFRIQDGAYAVTMGIAENPNRQGAADPDSRVVAEHTERKACSEEEYAARSLAEQAVPQTYTDSIKYANALNGADLVYESSGYGIKESIVVPAPQEAYSYAFTLTLEGLTANLEEDGSISLCKDGKCHFVIPAPYMTDADGAYSDAVAYVLTAVANGSYLLTVTADKDWMNAEDRAFPVTIDPSVYMEGNASNTNIITGYVNNSYANTVTPNHTDIIRAGYCGCSEDGINGRNIGFLFFRNLPSVPTGCTVTNAQLNLYQTYAYGDTQVFVYPSVVTIHDSTGHEIGGNVTEGYVNGLTWNSFHTDVTYGGTATPSLDHVHEYYVTDNNCTKGENYWDITAAVQKWYNGSTDISRLLVMDTGTSNDGRGTYAGYHYDSSNQLHLPQLIVTYRNTVGVEGIYSYHTQDIGRAGIGYVNDNSLNLTVAVPIMNAPSAALPFSLELVYNSALSKQFFDAASNIHTEDYATSQIGKGWKASVQQTVVSIRITDNNSNANTYLIYTDSDGTEHYFSKRSGSSTVYEDEDGLGLTITVTNSTTYTMKDKENNTWEFKYGYLTVFTDYHGNSLYYAYNGIPYSSGSTGWKPSSAGGVYRVTSVWRRNDGAASAQRLVSLGYEGNFLRSITDSSNRTTTLSSDGTRLTEIAFPDGKTASYTYLSVGGLMLLAMAKDEEATYQINYTYQSRLGSQRIDRISETTNNLPGQAMHAYKQDAVCTIFRYYGADGQADTNDDLTSKHYFDNWGRPVNVGTYDGMGARLYGVSVGTYTTNTGNSKRNNRMTAYAESGVQSFNLLNNGGLEHQTNLLSWTLSGDGAGIAQTQTETATNVLPRTGNRLLKLYLFNTSTVGEACKQSVYLFAGKTYVFSAYVNTACAESIGEDGAAYLSVECGTGASAEVCRSREIKYSTNTAIAAGWERLEVSVSPTSNGVYSFCANTKDIFGVTAFDDFQLEEVIETGAAQDAYSASNVNLLQRGSFERYTNSGALDTSQNDNWWTRSPSSQIVQQAYTGRGAVLYFKPDTYSKHHASQTVPLNAASEKTYLISAWGKAPGCSIDNGKTIENDNSNNAEFFGIIAKLKYTDGVLEYHHFPFVDDISAWQYLAGTIAPKRANKKVEAITVILASDFNSNGVYMDGISLLQEPVQTYVYDEKGDQTSAVTSGNNQTNTTYDSSSRLTSYTALNGVQSTLTYSGTNRDPQTVTTAGVTNEYTYDAAGNTTKTVARATNGAYLQTETAYNASKDFMTSVTDSSGSTSSTSYNNKGLLTSSTDANGTTTERTYNSSNDRSILTYQSGLACLTNLYTAKGQLLQLTRSSKPSADANFVYQGYHFTYDARGNTTAIRVWKPASNTATAVSNAITLSSYEYNSYGQLKRMDFSNGAYVRYDYDLLDRPVKEEYYNSNDVLQATNHYVYNANGVLSRQYRTSGSQITEEYFFEYDSLGRLIRSRETGSTVQQTEHLYDKANRLTSQKYQLGVNTFTETYAYHSTNGTLTQMQIGSGRDISYGYDGLLRLQSETLSGVYRKNRTYKTVSGSRSSGQVDTLSYYNAAGTVFDHAFRYSYTNTGNISKLERKDTAGGSYYTDWQYSYDQLGQLTTAASPTRDLTYSYQYDSAGNLTQASAHGTYHSEQDFSHTYSYTNTSWLDLLTAFDNGKIAYEGQTYNSRTNTVTGTAISGNPVSYYNGTRWAFSWENGRQLKRINNGEIIYTYDMEGLRSSKTVNNVLHEYACLSGRVVRETWNGNVLTFFYDATGKPAGLWYKPSGGSTQAYYYQTNLQGDVTGIYDGTGTLLAVYDYDPFGKLVSVKNAAGTAITSSTHIANINPLRYRGYYYDTETGFYYLQSRYYDPIVCRFINADSYASTGQGFVGCNMFAYCGNNPVTRADPTGEAWWHWVAAAAIAVALVAATVVTCGGAAAAVATISAVAMGACTTVGTTATVVAGAALGAGTALAISAISSASESRSVEEFAEHGEAALINTVIGGGAGAMNGYVNSQVYCFVAGTVVKIENGEKPIEEISAGDFVWAWDENTGNVALKPVVETYTNETGELIHVFVHGEEIICTPTHPFYSPVKGWTDAVRLRAGDILVLVSGKYVVVEKVQHELLEAPVKVYNFQVEDYHTYYVASIGVLVHNSCNHNSSWNSERRNYWKNEAKTAEPNVNYGSYVANEDNLNRMTKGLAPIGWDGYSVQLHHWEGIAVNFYNYSAVSRTLHVLIHQIK